MKRYDRYSKYEDRWITSLPSHWGYKRLKEVLKERKEKNSPVKTHNILSLTNTRGVIPYSEKGNVGNKAKESLEGYMLAYPNDIVINSMNIIIGSVGLSKYFGAVSPVYYMLYTRNNDNIRYFNYVFQNKPFQESLRGLGNGILEIRMRIPMYKLNNVCIPVPPRSEQDQIVRYLDWQVSKINKLIAAKKKQIVFLKECRKAVIDTAILHGMNKHTEEKDSGVYWLGRIPASWEVLPLRRICSINASISHLIKKLPSDELVVFLPMESVSTEGIVDCSQKKPLHEVRTGYSSFARNDVVVAKITPCFENGKGACLDKLDTEIGFGTTEFINIRASEKVLPQYLYYITITQPFRILGAEVMTGSAGQKRISTDFIKNFTLGIPDIKEQQELLNILNDNLLKIDNAIQLVASTIDTLHEYRTRLISDVVTGQIDVRDIEIPEYEYAEEEPDEESDDIESVEVETEEQEEN